MQQTVIRVLLVEDNASDAQRVQDALACAKTTQFAVAQVDSEAGARTSLAQQSVDVVVLEFGLHGGSGFDILARLRTAAPEIPVVVLSNRADEDLSLQAVQAGAQDYLVKSQIQGLLVRAIRHAVERAQADNTMRSVKARLQRTIDGSDDGLWDWLDVTTDAIWWSPGYFKQLGFAPDEVAPSVKLFRSLLHPDDIQSFECGVAKTVAEGRDINWEYRVRHRNGQYLCFKARGKAYRDGARVGI
nr:response regulator [Rhodoferax sp.]